MLVNGIQLGAAAIAWIWQLVWKTVANLAIGAAEWVVNTWNEGVHNIQSFFANLGKTGAQVFKTVAESAGSAASNIANAFIKGFTKEIVLGDINSDKVFDIQDLSVALLYFSEKTSQKLNNDELYNLDVNEDKEIDIRDLSKMILMIAGIEE